MEWIIVIFKFGYYCPLKRKLMFRVLQHKPVIKPIFNPSTHDTTYLAFAIYSAWVKI